MKKCVHCGELKSSLEFSKRSVSSDGLNSKCKPCATAAHRAWCADNKDKVKGYNASRTPRPEYERERWHRTRKYSRYGITAEVYQELLDSQGGGCAICGTDENLCVDHDHNCCPTVRSCGKCVRGLLCRAHNAALGGFNDDPAVLTQAIAYLDR